MSVSDIVGQLRKGWFRGPTIGVLSILAISVGGWLASGRLSVGSSSSAWQPRLIIMIVGDAMRADHIHCYGYPRALSPNIDHLAREGVVFENAFSQSNYMLGSCRSILSGLYPPVESPGVKPHGAAFDPTQWTIASSLAKYHIQTAGFVGGGPLTEMKLGFDQFVVTPRWLHFKIDPVTRWLTDHAQGKQPGFLFIHGFDTHRAFIKPLHFSRMFDGDYDGKLDDLLFENASFHTAVSQRGLVFLKRGKDGVRRPVPISPRDIQHVIAGYDGSLSYFDINVGILMSEIYRLGLKDSVLVILTSDYGSSLFEGPEWGHSIGWADQDLHVPLIFWGPGGLRPRRVDQVVELIDLFPTILDFMNVSAPVRLTGHSLKELVQGNARQDHAATAVSMGRPSMLTIRSHDYRLTESGEKESLYDIHSDPYQRNALKAPPRDVVSALRARLDERQTLPHH